MSAPYAVPTAATHLWRSPSKTLEEGDGVVIVFPDGSKRHGIVAQTQNGMALIDHPSGSNWVDVEWEDQP